MKIALVRQAPTYADWYKQPMLGLGYICSYLEKNGFTCRIFDAYFFRRTQEELYREIIDYNPDVIGISAMTYQVTSAAQLASKIKKKLKVPVVIGGSHITIMPQKTLEEFSVFDYGVYGEGEYAVLELLKYLEGEPSGLELIKGLVYRDKDSSVRVNEPRPFLKKEELDLLPYPAYHQYYAYTSSVMKAMDYYVIVSSRGCPCNCIFCSRASGRVLRQRSAEGVIGEIEFAISKYRVNTINFADEIFLFNCPDTRDMLRQIIQRGISKKIRWSGLVRADLVNEDIIALAKQAGCYRLGMGVESGDDSILKDIQKADLTTEKIKQAVKIIKKYGIELETYFILGHPNETLETLKKTVNLAVELNTSSIAVGIMVPYPGTKIYEMAQRGEGGYRLLSNDWSQYDKYGTKVLELKNLTHKELLKWQVRAYVYFYLKNFRLVDFVRFFYKRRRLLVYFFKKGMPPLNAFLKRIFDIYCALFCLMASLLLWALIPAAIYFEGGRSLFFSDFRVGRSRKIYRHFKFRSMIVGAEYSTGPVWSKEQDVRVTKIGRLLRATAMDELPQLWNILKGDMSFVGPRPERPFFVEKFIKKIPNYEKRFDVRPGLTGMAQIYGKYDTPADEKLKYDLEYIEKMNIYLDLRLIFLSFIITLKGGWAKFENTGDKR